MDGIDPVRMTHTEYVVSGRCFLFLKKIDRFQNDKDERFLVNEIRSDKSYRFFDLRGGHGLPPSLSSSPLFPLSLQLIFFFSSSSKRLRAKSIQ